MKKLEIRLALLLSLLLYSCDRHKEKTVYYDDGKTVKNVAEYNSDDVKDGEEKYFFHTGVLMATSTWKNGKKNGVFKQYFNNGVLGTIGHFNNDLLVGEIIDYYPDGKVEKISYYDSLSRLIDYKLFNKDGTRNKKIEPLWWLERDTIKMGETAKGFVKLANIPDLRFNHGLFIRTSEFTPGKDNRRLYLKDTLEIIESKENNYPFLINGDKKGVNFIRGLIVVNLSHDTTRVVSIEDSYFVK
jgi:hypothetical protein